MQAIQRLLRRAWWRLVVIDLLGTLAVTLTAAAVLLAVWRVLQSVIPVPGAWGEVASIGAAAALAIAAAWSLVRTRPGHAVARRVDERARLRETLSTALCVSQNEDAWSRATVELAGRTAAGVDLAAALPVQAPRLWPAPVAAWGLLAILLAAPALDLSAVLGRSAPDPIPEHAALRVSAEVEQMKDELRAEAARLGVDIGFEGEAAENAIAPTNLTPEEIQAAAVKELTRLTDTLAERMEEKGAQRLEAMEKRLEQLRQPGPGPAQDLARAMARGNFEQARQELSKLAQQLRDGELSAEQREQLQEQMENLAKQLDELGRQRADLERSLREAGMSADQAGQMALADPEALRKALDELKSLTPEQRKQLLEKAKAQAEACSQCNSMGQSMSEMAAALSPGGMSSGGQMAMDQFGDMLSEMEMLASDIGSMKAMMSAAQTQSMKVGGGFCENPGSGIGGPRAGWGVGGSQGTPPDESKLTFDPTRSAVNARPGAIIGSRLVYEGQIRGESRVEFAQSAAAAAAGASDAIESMLVPRQYEAAVMRYFGALRDAAQPNP